MGWVTYFAFCRFCQQEKPGDTGLSLGLSFSVRGATRARGVGSGEWAPRRGPELFLSLPVLSSPTARVYSLIYLSIQQTFNNHLPCARYCSRQSREQPRKKFLPTGSLRSTGGDKQYTINKTKTPSAQWKKCLGRGMWSVRKRVEILDRWPVKAH